MRRVVVIGGGYAGLHAFRAFRKRMHGALLRGDVDITLVARDPYHTYHGWTGEVLAGRLHPAATFSDIRDIAGGAYLQGDVVAIDAAARKAVVAVNDEQHVLHYDDLVVAIGSIDPLSRIPGSEEHAWRLKNTHDMEALSHHLDRGHPGRIVVIGGGFAGVETASALALRYGPGVVTIVSGTRPPLADEENEIPVLVRHARKLLDRQGVGVISGVRAVAVDADGVALSNGDRIPSRTTIVAAGIQFPLIPGMEALPRHADGRLLVDRSLRVLGVDGLWAAGDIARVERPGRVDETCPVDALWAMKQGDHVGAAIADVARERPVRRFGFRGMGRAAGMAGRNGVSELYGMQFTGTLAWLLRISFFAIYMPRPLQGLRVMLGLLRGGGTTAKEGSASEVKA